MKKPTTRQRGFTVIELLAALAIGSMVMAGIAMMINTSLEDARGQQAALYQSQLAQASAQLIQQNATALSAAATATTPVVVKLQGTPFKLSTYLPDGVQGQNAYGQTPCLLVYATSNGALQGLLVTEGGMTIPDAQLGYIAANAGPGGGSIPLTHNPGGAALGAYGAWSIATPNPANVSCSSTKTGVGHLVSEIFPDNSQGRNADFLYRVSVPGNPTANTMQVPIVLAQQIDFTPCTAPAGSVAADSASNVVTCRGGQWQPVASLHWRDPVEAAADLGDTAKVPNPARGDVAMTTNTGRAYTFNGTAWQAIAVDEMGVLNLGNEQAQGNACAPTAASTTPVTTDASGRVLSCQNGIWQTQAEITPGSNTTECQILMASTNANDYPGCSGPPSNNYFAPPFSFNTGNGTFTYTRIIPVQLTKPGIVSVSSWAHLNDGLCNSARAARAQLSQDVDILDGAGNSLAHTEAQGPTLANDSGGINNSLAQALPPGSYRVSLLTNWATYDGVTTPWNSSFCGEQFQEIANTPVAAGWTVNTYY
ncbi:shufflon system plasmid conjugative transfer pilus tip adhesin PilV [Paraburkholderia rhizosphaerae]|uniref:Prepilin-type N-terminal cleavage/methylation domain-containing protein n=1 Tax=Paraburkholderia rhizosphaerae TaxID=480658 RepID=A0A4R8LNG3_9BURK|nr:shufflon system plasmid conjugative transfer pilus tip adhesin PilV [Paraburkholderia rhizosphaerae]TDY45180.1 prepilin-type N-terminal cleavage/methylation domain-containing protein [Paraburkholderia rhizosphaerae]